MKWEWTNRWTNEWTNGWMVIPAPTNRLGLVERWGWGCPKSIEEGEGVRKFCLKMNSF